MLTILNDDRRPMTSPMSTGLLSKIDSFPIGTELYVGGRLTEGERHLMQMVKFIKKDTSIWMDKEYSQPYHITAENGDAMLRFNSHMGDKDIVFDKGIIDLWAVIPNVAWIEELVRGRKIC